LEELEVEEAQGFTLQEMPDGEGGGTTWKAAYIPGGGPV